MGLLDRFKALLGVDAPVITLDLPNAMWRQGDTLRALVKVEARTTPLELLGLRARVVTNPPPDVAGPLRPDWGEYDAELDRRLGPGERLEKELVLRLDCNTPVPSEDLQVLLVVQLDVRGIPAPVAQRPLQILPSVTMQAVIDSMVEGMGLRIEEVGASLESREFGLLYPDCTMVAFEACDSTYALLGPSAKSLEDVFLSNERGGIKLYLFAPNGAERWQRARDAAGDFCDRYHVRYQTDIEELSLVLPEDEIFAPDRTVQSRHIAEIIGQSLRFVGGGTEKLF